MNRQLTISLGADSDDEIVSRVYNFLISKQFKYLVDAFIYSKLHTIPLINIFFKFILQFKNYWMIINADTI